MSRACGEAGFTLSEMLVVLAILSLIAGASGLAFTSGQPGRDLSRTVERLADDLDRTRTDAIRSGHTQSLDFDLPARLWHREAADPAPIPQSLTIQLTTAGAVEAGDGAASIAFRPDGRSTGGRIDVTAGSSRRSLVVDGRTGTVREIVP